MCYREKKQNGKIIDMRSDTFTLPTEDMLNSISKTKLGDDGYREDPTVNKLERMAADMFGKESALLVSSGTLGNLLALISHSNSTKNEIILGQRSHIFQKELKPIENLFNFNPRSISEHRGCMDINELKENISSRTALVSIENTHSRANGAIIPLSYFKKIKEISEKQNFSVHIDGARLFNAIIASGIDPKDYGCYTDSIMVCLSKGLSAPVGSLLIGKDSFINKARKWRKYLGGGMRQSGIIAAPGVIALQNIEILKNDHTNAKLLANELFKIKDIYIDPNEIETNIVIANISKLNISTTQFVNLLKKNAILIREIDCNNVRFVVNRHVKEKDIYQTVKVIKETF